MFLHRPNRFLHELAQNALGADAVITDNSPLYHQLRVFSGEEYLNLLQLRIMCFATSTWFNHASGIRPYLALCNERAISPYPVNQHIVELCILKLAQEGKSSQVIRHLVQSVTFASNFLGYKCSAGDFKKPLKFASKLCKISNNEKAGLQTRQILDLWTHIVNQGGLSKLSIAEIRTFVLVVFCHETLCRFSCASSLKMSHVHYYPDHFEFRVPFSKTDQEGEGQSVLLVSKEGRFNPHMLMCLYLHVMKPEDEDYLFPPLE